MAQLKRMKSPILKYRITDDGIYLRSELGSGKTPWSVFKGLRKNKKIWRVIAPSKSTISLPVELLDEELKAFLSSQLPSKTRGAWNWFSILLGLLLLILIFFLYFIKQPPR
jgi:hypothetical protein